MSTETLRQMQSKTFSLTVLDWFLEKMLQRVDSELYQSYLDAESTMDVFKRGPKIMIGGIETSQVQWNMSLWLNEHNVIPLFLAHQEEAVKEWSCLKKHSGL